MRTILYLIRKEFLQIFRNRFISRAIFAMPLIQLVILVPAVTFEMKNIRIAVNDNDMSHHSREIISRLQGSPFFLITHSPADTREAENLLHAGESDMALIIPSDFGNRSERGDSPELMVLVNAINASSAQLSWAYMQGILSAYNLSLADEMQLPEKGINGLIVPQVRFWYNPSLNYKFYMLPGVLVILVTAIGLLLAGLNVVKEKESGTIEQINVTPIRKYQFITAKLVPFLIIGLADLAFGLILGKILFSIPFEGSIPLLFLFATIYLTAVLGIALFFSTISTTQQQYLFVVFFILLIFVLMSGIFTPEESMPLWAQKFNTINPAAYFMRVIRMIILKGSELNDILPEIRALIMIAITTISLAIWRYRKTA